MKRTLRLLIWGMAVVVALASGLQAAETVTTVVNSRIGNGYKRERLADGSFKPEHYALANGGLIEGTTRDTTIERVTYPEVAEIAARFLLQQNYHYAQTKEQAKLLLVLNWGATISYNNMNYGHAVQQLSAAANALAANRMYGSSTPEDVAVDAMAEQLLMVKMENRARDQINLPNAKIIGYLDAINVVNDIRRWAGGGDRYNDLVADLEEPRYYIVISAYDFPKLLKSGKKTLLWQTRVSVRSPGNSFDDSFVPMLKSASKYFGQDSGKLMREEQEKAKVELGDLKFLGEAKEPPETKPEPKK